ncbi:hypothetical protein BLOT_013993 [Blomia tropicalis]|nr:hypothetical protein BLOT_013993 [Blomia tropicalis]
MSPQLPPRFGTPLFTDDLLNGVNGVIYYSYHFNVQKIDLNFMKVIKLMQVIDPNHFNYRRDQ